MKKTQLIAVLKTFDKKEHKTFTKWLASPIFNQRTDAQRLYKYLIQANHLKEDKFLEKERVFKKIFPATPFDDAKLRQTVHFLLKQVEDFLVYQQQKEDLLGQQLLLTKIYRNRKIVPSIKRQLKICKKKFSTQIQKSTYFHRLEYELSNESLSFTIEQFKRTDAELKNSIQMLDVFLITEKLKQACLALTLQNVFKSESQLRLIPSILNIIKNDMSLMKHHLIACYYHIYLMQVFKNSNQAEYHYFSLKKIIEKKLSSFQTTERRDIYLMTLNYCVGKMNAGQQEFVREAFDLYKKGFEDQIIIQNGTLSTIAYLNTSSIALRLKEYKWVEKFVEQYTPYLEIKHQRNFKQYTLARLLFDQKKYNKATHLLVKFESKHILVNLLAKSMLLKMYFELDEINALESFLDSFSIYLRRKEIAGSHKVNYQNIVKYTRKLLRLNPYDKEKRVLLRKEIMEANPLAERRWLLEQIDKL